MQRFMYLFMLILGLHLNLALAKTNQLTKIPILTYHNFDPNRSSGMTINPKKFEEQLKWLKQNGYTVISLKELTNYLQGKNVSLPSKAVVITVDDGKKSVYRYMLPLVKKYNVPVTLFIYPISISKSAYALTWDQLKELQQTGLFTIEGHTYWHPNFSQEKKKLSLKEYEKFVHIQLVNSKKIIEKKLGIDVTLLAWPYGFYNKYLEQQAEKAGYVMAFSVDDRDASRAENTMAQPRYTVQGRHSMKTFARMVGPGFQ